MCQSLDLIKKMSLVEYRLHFWGYNAAVTDDWQDAIIQSEWWIIRSLTVGSVEISVYNI